MTILDIVSKARTLESRIARALSQAASEVAGSSAPEPLEIVHAVVDDVEAQIQSGGRGAHVFPFNSVAVSVLAPSRAARARLEAAFCGKPPLRDRLLERLRSAGCDIADLHVDVAYVGRAAVGWTHPHFTIAFECVAPDAPAPVAPVESTLPRVEVVVLRGAAERRSYVLAGPRIELGRGAEVRDSRNRLLSTNHVVFVDGSPGENQTVSRRHAHIAHDPASGGYRLYDDGSLHGSGIVREGRTIPVPPGSRGVRVRSGDEIVLGEARVRIRLAFQSSFAQR